MTFKELQDGYFFRFTDDHKSYVRQKNGNRVRTLRHESGICDVFPQPWYSGWECSATAAIVPLEIEIKVVGED